jgi:hypothetical protein
MGQPLHQPTGPPQPPQMPAIQRRTSRRRPWIIGAAVSGALLLLFLLVGEILLAVSGSGPKNGATPSTSRHPGSVSAASPYGYGVKVIDTVHSAQEGAFVYVKVPAGLTDQQIVDLSRRISRAQQAPRTMSALKTFYLLDDASKVRQFLSQHTSNPPASTTAWFQRHIVATVFYVLAPGGANYWAVNKGEDMGAQNPLAKFG